MNSITGKILIVEDEVDILDFLSSYFKELGMQVVTAQNGQMGFEYYEQQGPFDAVLSDITMPGLSGLQLLEKIRKLGKNVPFVILSAHGTEENVQKALELGAFDFIQKPWGEEDLNDTVQRAIELGRMIQLWESDPSMKAELDSFLKENSRRSKVEVSGKLPFPGRMGKAQKRPQG
jgi:DNA-binding NtrC family response regulator